ncbi:ribosome hibernation-promoting factor, HPF/YfiA family [Candidatus Kinetoplastidibacterium galati]|uniref:Sigma 54 modulation protein/S30EA ribosomal protein n=1 Tax=Candidatus Kinetoplastidibacterium galati TCC219 TaxID=1208921 RepID=M1LA08_9PROT|nr:ribosome-associated translation inhibitor RaiA [Candidatus Kinetoplastibacterium galatii]AGF49353.1 sigma 54 modulation protein/S30EA ribosomal protein [Candidatus Kinetoplastibacterium galatii TCC219]
MDLNIIGRNVEITTAMNEYISKKLSNTLLRIDSELYASVSVYIEHSQHNIEINIRHINRTILHCKSSDTNLYDAVDSLAEKVNRQLVKLKEKEQEKFF